MLVDPSGQLVGVVPFFDMLVADPTFDGQGGISGSGLTIAFDADNFEWVVVEGLLEGTVDSPQSASLTASSTEGVVASIFVGQR